MKKYIIFGLSVLLFVYKIYAWEDCQMPGYSDCIMQNSSYDVVDENGTIITGYAFAKLAVTIYDDRGILYKTFNPSSWALGGVYADIYYEGNELWYLHNMSNWSSACDEYGCQGMLLDSSGVYQIAALGDEYVWCPTFIAADYEADGGYAWAGLGYPKPIGNTCCHVRVARCIDDSNCQNNYHCHKDWWNKSNNWREWSCQPKACEDYEFGCLGWKNASFLKCIDHEWFSASTEPFSSQCTGENASRQGTTWFVTPSSLEVFDLDLDPPEGPLDVPMSPKFLGQAVNYKSTYDKADLALILENGIGTTLSSIVSVTDLLVLAGVMVIIGFLIKKIGR
jgi:hypothetical protein